MCKVCDRTDVAQKRKTRFADEAYCSIYCQMFDEQNLTKYYPSDNVHTKHFEHFPPIESICENCGGSITLRWSVDKANKAFCGNECTNNKSILKRSRKHYPLLKILKHNTKPLNAAELAKRAEHTLRYRYNSDVVGQCMRYYVAKGIVECETHTTHGTFKTYWMSDWAKEMPICQLLRGNSKVNKGEPTTV
jgi:hypothetical protein